MDPSPPSPWPPWMPEPGPRDWPEDAVMDTDNGCYENRCCVCGFSFIGHKRRLECKICTVEAQNRWDALTPEQQEAQLQRNTTEIARWMEEHKSN